ncbi:MAG: hypothetical protein IPM29_01420 [Planctomycetes bacterium]|nr:hypothetical protein [Planctomycetota bacterium]
MARRPLTVARLAAATLAALLPVAAPGAQDPTPPKPDERPVAWPKLGANDELRIKRELRQLGDADPEVAAAAEAGLVEHGAGVAPYVIRRLDDTEVANVPALRRVLDTVVDWQYLPLVVKRADDKSVELRRWVVRWLARAHDERAAAVLRAASTDADPQIAFCAVVGRLGLGDADALEPVLRACSGGDWREQVSLCAEVLPAVRGARFADALIQRIADQDELTRVAGLRLLRYLAPASHARLVATFLNASEHGVKKAAINALRVIVDGAAPMEELSVFQAIDMANAWKERVK